MKNFMQVLTLIGSLLLATSVFAVDAINTTKKGVAVKGYDTVAYFTQNAAVEGSDEFQTEWSGATWKFSSQENLDLFTGDPEKYAPQYGGYCAFAVSNDATARIDPEVFHIHDDKLYLNFNARIQKRWLPEKAERIELADEYWPGLID